MKIEQFADKVSTALGDELVSLIVYGSAATSEPGSESSDANTLVVAKQWRMSELKRLSESVQVWIKKGNPPPMLFTRERLKKSSDVFPIELLDIKERHKVIFGEDVFKDIVVDARHLRFQVEHELKGKLLHLRDGYLVTNNKPKRIAELLVRSLSTFQLLFRAALRLYEFESKIGKIEAVVALGEHVTFDVDAFAQVQALKVGELSYKKLDCEDLFDRILHSVSTVADAVDGLDK